MGETTIALLGTGLCSVGAHVASTGFVVQGGPLGFLVWLITGLFLVTGGVVAAGTLYAVAIGLLVLVPFAAAIYGGTLGFAVTVGFVAVVCAIATWRYSQRLPA